MTQPTSKTAPATSAWYSSENAPRSPADGAASKAAPAPGPQSSSGFLSANPPPRRMQAMNAPDEPARLIRVLIVEDHPVVAEGLASLLEDYPEITIAEVAFSVAEVSPAIEKATTDVAVIDYHLPDGRGDRPDDPRCGRGRDRHPGWHHHAGPGPVPRRRPAARAPGTARKS